MHATITRAVREDAFALGALKLQMDREFDLPPRPGFLDDFANHYLQHFDALPTWIAKASDGAPLGFIQAATVQRIPSLAREATPNLHIGNVFVTPTARNLGLGERLLGCAVRYAREQGCGRVTIKAVRQARPLYERVGFDAPPDGWMDLVVVPSAREDGTS